MKRLLCVLFSMILFTGLFAADVKKETSFTKAQKMPTTRELEDRLAKGFSGTIYHLNSTAAAGQGVKVGETAYNYQTNGILHDRIIWNPTTKAIHVQWMYGDISETGATNFPNRFMYYNYFDGSKWTFGLGQPIESKSQRYGYGCLEADANFEAISISHHNAGLSLWKDFAAGFGFFVESQIWGEANEPPALNPTWPDVAVDKAGNWHAIATNYNDVDAVDIIDYVKNNIVYWRSTNKGATWSNAYGLIIDPFQFPIEPYDDTLPKELDIEKMIEPSDKDNTVAVLIPNYGHDLIWYESNDAGLTWKEPVALLGYKPIVATDSVNIPPQYDIVIQYDSLNTTVPIDTSAYPWEEEYNIASRPLRGVDFMFINGEPHIVWAQAKTPGGGSYYPGGRGISYNAPQFRTLKGDTIHWECGFSIKHWSPSTGVSMIEKEDDLQGVYTGGGYTILAAPQICKDLTGNLYCVYARASKTDTVTAADNIDQAKDSWGPLSYCKLWGSKSTDGGKTWSKPVQLTKEEDNIHRDLRFASVSNTNPNNAIQILFQDSPIPASAIQEEHTVWGNADIMYWACPTSLFSNESIKFGPEIEIFTNTKGGVLDFGDIGDAGVATKTFMVENVGDQDLIVEPMFAGSKAFTAAPNNFTLAPGGKQEVTVTFKPVVPDSENTYLAIPNSDKSERSAGLPLIGIGVPDLSAVDNQSVPVPSEYSLAQNYPNPFNPATAIQFGIAQEGQVKLVIYDALGKEVEVLVNKNMQAGVHKVEWKAENLPSGLYFYRLTAGDFNSTKKMILMQ